MGIFDFLKKKELVPYDKIYKELDIFTATSLAMPKMNNPFLLDNKSKHPMIFGYFMGVLEYMAQAYDLDKKDQDTIQIHNVLHNFANNDDAYAAELVQYCDEIKNRDDVSNYSLRGKLAMKKWKAGGPMAEYAPMGLIRILND